MQSAENIAADGKALYKHLQTNRIYCLLTHATDKSTGEDMVVYQSVKTGRIWIRPSQEFFDGRFEEVSKDAAQSPSRATSNASSGKRFGAMSWLAR